MAACTREAAVCRTRVRAACAPRHVANGRVADTVVDVRRDMAQHCAHPSKDAQLRPRVRRRHGTPTKRLTRAEPAHPHARMGSSTCRSASAHSARTRSPARHPPHHLGHAADLTRASLRVHGTHTTCHLHPRLRTAARRRSDNGSRPTCRYGRSGWLPSPPHRPHATTPCLLHPPSDRRLVRPPALTRHVQSAVPTGLRLGHARRRVDPGSRRRQPHRHRH